MVHARREGGLADFAPWIAEEIGQQMRSVELWIGVVELKPLNREAYGAAGAFTNIVTWARDVEESRAKSEVIAGTLSMYVMGVEEAEPLADRTKKCQLTEEVADMVFRAESNPNAIIYGTFHQYPFDEA
jgi:hypothetical protein